MNGMEHLETRPALSLTNQLVKEIELRDPMHRKFVHRSLAALTNEELSRLEQYLAFCESSGADISYISESYLTVVQDTIAEQMFFLQNSRYRHSTYDEVADFVYNNVDYMNRYMYGLVITAFLWTNHVEMSRFFAKRLPCDRGGAYLEIGPGHGYYMMTAVSRSKFSDFVGVDVSQASINQTRALINHFAPGAADRIDLRRCDFLSDDSLSAASFDAIVMGEVLEHVENPGEFLKRIAMLARPGAFIYVTTCINAPAIDHIFLWRSIEELETLFAQSGLEVKEGLKLPYEGRTLEQSIAQKLSINVAYVLEKL